MDFEVTKGALAYKLSRLLGFGSQKVRLEQYETPSQIAADSLWEAKMQGDIKGKLVVDLGAGAGILGIGALILGAKTVIFIEKDPEAVLELKKNLTTLKSEGIVRENSYEILQDDIANIQTALLQVDTVVQNPPFGTKDKHADMRFLSKALEAAPVVYSFHKSETLRYITDKMHQEGHTLQIVREFAWGITGRMRFHAKKMHYIRVSLLRIVRAI